jgi:type VI secretion system protein VasI
MVRRITLVAATSWLLISATTLKAQEAHGALALCTAVANSVERLGCYDKVAKNLGVDRSRLAHATMPANRGKWTVETSVSRTDGSETVVLTLAANEMVYSRYSKDTPVLKLRCKDKTTSAYIAWDAYIAPDQSSVLTRLDERPASRETWELSTDNKTTFAPDPVAFIKSLLGRARLASQVTADTVIPVFVTFDIAGIDTAIQRLRQACHW